MYDEYTSIDVQVKKAYFTLMDEERRRNITATIEYTRKRILKERKQKMAKGSYSCPALALFFRVLVYNTVVVHFGGDVCVFKIRCWSLVSHQG